MQHDEPNYTHTWTPWTSSLIPPAHTETCHFLDLAEWVQKDATIILSSNDWITFSWVQFKFPGLAGTGHSQPCTFSSAKVVEFYSSGGLNQSTYLLSVFINGGFSTKRRCGYHPRPPSLERSMRKCPTTSLNIATQKCCYYLYQLLSHQRLMLLFMSKMIGGC